MKGRSGEGGTVYPRQGESVQRPRGRKAFSRLGTASEGRGRDPPLLRVVTTSAARRGYGLICCLFKRSQKSVVLV